MNILHQLNKFVLFFEIDFFLASIFTPLWLGQYFLECDLEVQDPHIIIAYLHK